MWEMAVHPQPNPLANRVLSVPHPGGTDRTGGFMSPNPTRLRIVQQIRSPIAQRKRVS